MLRIEKPEDRPSWDDYFMAIAAMASQRSLDPSTAHGAVVVNDDRQIIGIGYNGPPPGMDDALVPLTRPEKYDWFEHSEVNALANCNASVRGSTVYVTGHPCQNCFRHMLCRRVKRCVYGPIGSNCVDGAVVDTISAMNKAAGDNGIEMVVYSGNVLKPLSILEVYWKSKTGVI